MKRQARGADQDHVKGPAANAARAQPGKSSLTEQFADATPASPPLFAGAQWEDIENAEEQANEREDEDANDASELAADGDRDEGGGDEGGGDEGDDGDDGDAGGD